MWVWFASIGVSWVKWWIGMVGCGLWVTGFGFGLIWMFFWVFSWVDHVASTFSRYFLGWSVYHESSSDRCGFDIFLGWSSAFFWVFSTAWVSNRRHGFADRWLGWWVWWPLLAPTGLMVSMCVALLMVCVYVCGFVDDLMVCVCMCVWWWVWIGWSVYHWWFDGLCLYVCVVMGLDRLIGVSWVSACVLNRW